MNAEEPERPDDGPSSSRGATGDGDGGTSSSTEADDTETVEIHGIASDGAGVGRLDDGRIVFVHRSAPGETVRIRLTRRKKTWARGRLVEVLRPSPDRRPAPCPHYERCGGCTLEHLGYEAQLRWKGRIVTDALKRIGGVDVPPPDVRPSPERLRYRSRITLTLRRLAGGRVVAGFHELERADRIVDLGGECLLPVEEISTVWERVRAHWGPGARALPAGRELRLTQRALDEGVLLVVEGGSGHGDPEALLDRVDGLVSVQVVEGPHRSRVTGRSELTDRFLDRTVRVRGGAFLQVNRAAGEALHEGVLERIGPPDGLRIVDGYCGTGVLGRILAERGARVTGIELDPDAVRGARADAGPGQEIVEGRVEESLSRCLPTDLLVVNPPRAGLHADIPEILRDRGPDRIVYVSCDPATLARDVDRIGASYALGSLDAFDLFPQTAHVECVAVLERT